MVIVTVTAYVKMCGKKVRAIKWIVRSGALVVILRALGRAFIV